MFFSYVRTKCSCKELNLLSSSELVSLNEKHVLYMKYCIYCCSFEMAITKCIRKQLAGTQGGTIIESCIETFLVLTATGIIISAENNRIIAVV